MWKRTLTRLLLIATVLVVTGGMLAFASSRAGQTSKAEKECTESSNAPRCKAQGDFIIWEVLNRTFFATLQ